MGLTTKLVAPSAKMMALAASLSSPVKATIRVAGAVWRIVSIRCFFPNPAHINCAKGAWLFGGH